MMNRLAVYGLLAYAGFVWLVENLFSTPAVVAWWGKEPRR